MKTWKPDTCDCVIEEIYNGSEIIGGGQVIKKCADHSTVLDEELYGVLYANPDGENKVKNQMHRILLGNDSVKGLGLEETVVTEDGSQETKFKKGVDYKWSFSGTGHNRKLTAEVVGVNLTKNQKDAIKALTDTKFGAGKVDIL